jgi:hypothetical protein
MPCHHALAEALGGCVEAGGIVEDRKGRLFRMQAGMTAVPYPTSQ